jgi:hypothetical protein
MPYVFTLNYRSGQIRVGEVVRIAKLGVQIGL